eukprot:5670263-Karenia_brevis.AAC.1
MEHVTDVNHGVFKAQPACAQVGRATPHGEVLTGRLLGWCHMPGISFSAVNSCPHQSKPKSFWQCHCVQSAPACGTNNETWEQVRESCSSY